MEKMWRAWYIFSYLSRVLNLLAQGHTEVYLHALGAAIPRAIHLALSVQSQIGPTLIQVRTHTDTVELTGTIKPFHKITFQSEIGIGVM